MSCQKCSQHVHILNRNQKLLNILEFRFVCYSLNPAAALRLWFPVNVRFPTRSEQINLKAWKLSRRRREQNRSFHQNKCVFITDIYVIFVFLLLYCLLLWIASVTIIQIKCNPHPTISLKLFMMLLPCHTHP